jgi:predicted metal-dependent TIM-barrel fold hydrolase
LFEAEAAAAVISKHGADRIVLTSDIGEGPTDLLALPKADDALKMAGLSAELRRRVLCEGPLGFLRS